jgi:Tol biopolymer transport system component
MRRSRTTLALIALAAAMCLLAASAQATFPGRNGRIAFADYTKGEIFAVNPDGTGLKKLTHVGPQWHADSPAWSPSGEQVIFSRSTDPFHPARIWIVRADGTRQHLLARDRGAFRDINPAFTPSGRQIVFARCRPNDGICAIFKMRRNGTHKQKLTKYREGVNEALDFNPSVSPNGRRIAFTRFYAGGVNSRIFVMGIGGGHEHAVTGPALEAAGPDWAPSGRRIAFLSNSQRFGESIYTVKPNGSGVRQVTPSRYPYDDLAPAFSPRGDRITFASDRNYIDACCYDLFTIGPTGGGEQMINASFANRGIIDPAWGTAPLIR